MLRVTIIGISSKYCGPTVETIEHVNAKTCQMFGVYHIFSLHLPLKQSIRQIPAAPVGSTILKANDKNAVNIYFTDEANITICFG